MIGYLEGTLLSKEDERILLLVNQVGYEILVPAFVMETLSTKTNGDSISLYIYHYQTERQPKPVLIGFNLAAEKFFFQSFISVEVIGPLKAVKALSIPVREIARAIEGKDVAGLEQLKGIGKRTAQKIIAALEGKMSKFALIRQNDQDDQKESPPLQDFTKQVLDVLVHQLGHKNTEAKNLVAAAMKRNHFISTPEELFEEVYRGETT